MDILTDMENIVSYAASVGKKRVAAGNRVKSAAAKINNVMIINDILIYHLIFSLPWTSQMTSLIE